MVMKMMMMTMLMMLMMIVVVVVMREREMTMTMMCGKGLKEKQLICSSLESRSLFMATSNHAFLSKTLFFK